MESQLKIALNAISNKQYLKAEDLKFNLNLL